MNTLKFKFLSTIVGTLKIVVNDKELVAILWDNEKPNRIILDNMDEDHTNSLILEVEKQLKQYFRGERQVFDLSR